MGERIYCHPQTDCFVLSELFSVARHAGRSKPGSKTVQLYVVLPLSRISLTLSRHSSLSSIAFSRSSKLHTVSIQSCCRYVQAGRPTPARPCHGVHKRTSVMSSSLLLEQWTECHGRQNFQVCVCVCVCVIFCCYCWSKDSKYFKMNMSIKRFVFLKNHLFCSYIRLCFQLVAFAREHMWHKAIWMGHAIRLELSHVGLLGLTNLRKRVLLRFLIPSLV